jgi:S-DNA-T family DNA segregation ATPase FtsK/SpoIIIE
MAKLASNNRQEVEESKTLSKPRIFFGLLFLFLSVVFALSFASYLLNWKANQSQTGAMLDKSIIKKATMKAAIPILSKIKIFPSQSPTFPKILEDLILLSNIAPV